MKKLERYRYLGRNGIVTTSVYLDGNEPELTKLKQEIINLYLM